MSFKRAILPITRQSSQTLRKVRPGDRLTELQMPTLKLLFKHVEPCSSRPSSKYRFLAMQPLQQAPTLSHARYIGPHTHAAASDNAGTVVSTNPCTSCKVVQVNDASILSEDASISSTDLNWKVLYDECTRCSRLNDAVRFTCMIYWMVLFSEHPF